jgi:hypothetical protein
MWWHVFHNNATGAHFGACANFNIADNRRIGTDKYAFPDLWMTITGYFSGASQGNTVENRNIVFNHCGFPDDESGGMVKHDAAADLSGGVDIHRENGADLVLQKEGQGMAFLMPEPISNPVNL